MKKFYRVANNDTFQGLWYDFDGKFTGLIHTKYDFCLNYKLQMEFDEELVGYLSATDTLVSLFSWFSKEDLVKLKEHNYSIHVYETDDFKWYERFEHWVINQKNCKLIEVIDITEALTRE